MSGFVGWSLTGILLLIAIVEWPCVSGQNVVFSDDVAGGNIDFISDKGIKLLLRWRQAFMRRIDALNNSMNYVSNLLNTTYSPTNLPDMESYMQGRLAEIDQKIALAESMQNDLNLTEKDEGEVYFYKSPLHVINNRNAYDPTNRDGGTFTVPEDGLYKVFIANSLFTYFSGKLMRNSNVTLATLNTGSIYEAKLRLVLRWLEQGDEIFITGDVPAIFGVIRLRMQTLVPHTI